MTPKPDTVSLRDYIETQFELRDRALQLQAQEYERRLEVLNHEHARAQETAQTYVAATKYEDGLRSEAQARMAALAAADTQVGLIVLDIADLKAFKSKALGIAALGAPLLLLTGGVIARLVFG